jgi:hypothetical protein
MTIYHLDAETFARLEQILTQLYGHGEVLTPDARRDLAHRLGLVVDTIRSCMEQVEEPQPQPELQPESDVTMTQLENIVYETTVLQQAAAKEGWCLSVCYGSMYGPLQVQSLDSPDEGAPRLDSDDEAHLIVRQGTERHHMEALRLLRIFNPAEYERVMNDHSRLGR